MPEKPTQDNHFSKIYWFIVYLTSFGMGFTVYLLVRFKGEVAERFADQMIIFWLSTAVSGGIGYLIGNSMAKTNQPANPGPPGTTKTDISATVVTDTRPAETVKEDKKD